LNLLGYTQIGSAADAVMNAPRLTQPSKTGFGQADGQRSEIHDGSEKVDRRTNWSIGFDGGTNPMFLDGRLEIAFDSHAVSLRVLKTDDGVVGGFQENSMARVRRCRTVGR